MKTRGQILTEFAILIVVIVAALIAMQTYLKRGIQGRLRASADSIGEQYDPKATLSQFTMRHNSNSTTTTTSEPTTLTTTECIGASCSQTTYPATMTTTQVETHYDNSIRNGFEIVAKPS